MIVQQLINGLTLGGTYSLVALGYTLIFGVLQIINLAHGEIFMVGAFVGYFMVEHLGLPLILALILAMAGAGVLGVILEFVCLRPLRRAGADRLSALISSIGLSIMLQNLVLRLIGPDSRPFAGALGYAPPWRLGPLVVSQVQAVVLFASFILMLALTYLLKSTRLGKGLRAVSENADAAALLGVPVGGMVLSAVVLASALGGAAGVLVGISFASVRPDMGLAYGLKGLAVIVLGGMGSVPGAMAGGLIIGMVETLAVAYGGSLWRDAIAYGLLLLILLLRPGGLFGNQAELERRS